MIGADGHTTFDTAIGPCAMAWRGDAVVAVHLPDPRMDERLARRHPGVPAATPPATVRDAVTRVTALLAGGADDLADVAVDLDGAGEFDRAVYAVTRAIAPGRTRSYGDVAAALGDRRRAREVGQALGRNPCPIIVPCHRVLAADGTLHGFSAPGGLRTKRRMLEIEGAAVPAEQPALF